MTPKQLVVTIGLPVVLGLAWPSLASAAGPNAVAAESLFSEGRALMQSGDYHAACNKFEASQKLERALGTSLNLANCYERMGRTASAWAEFRSAAAAARREGDAQREEVAAARAAALEGRLSRLTIVVTDPAVQIWRNDRAVAAETLGSAIPVDPGMHHVVARAEGMLPWSRNVSVAGEHEEVEVVVPQLAAMPRVPAPTRDPMMPAPSRSGEEGSTQRTLAWVAGGVGLGGLALGSVFGALAASNWSDAKGGCQDGRFECSDEAIARQGAAESRARLATVGFAVAAAGLTTGAVLLLTDPSDGGTEVALTPMGISCRGRF